MEPETPNHETERRNARRRSDIDIAVVTNTVEDQLSTLSTDLSNVKQDVKDVGTQIEVIGKRVDLLNLNGSAAGLRELGKYAPDLVTIVTQHREVLELDRAKLVVRTARIASLRQSFAWATGPVKVAKYVAPFVLGAIGITLVNQIVPLIQRLHIP